MTHTLCALHIRKAANHHISNKTNVHDRKAIQDACLKFHSGIFYQQRSAPFEEKVQNLKDSDMFKSQPKDFRDALERNIAQFRTKVVIPGEEVEKRQQYRTTNAVESQNFVMKSALDWKVTLLTDLVHNYFQKRYKVQDRFLERAIFGIGDYALTPGLEKLGLDKATWIAMDGKARERHFAKMFTALRRKHEKEAAAKGPRDLQADIPLSCEKEGDCLPCDEDDEGMDDFVDTGDDDFPARDLRSPAPDMSISMPSEEDAKSRSDKTRFDEEEVTDSEADADF